MLAVDGQSIRKMKANGQHNKENDVAFPGSAPLYLFLLTAPPFSLPLSQFASLWDFAALPFLTQQSSMGKIPSAGRGSL